MSKQANPTLIGAFVVGAILIAVTALILLGSGQLFRQDPQFVLYFDGSVKGLNVGAPVNYRGVNIGTVTDIRIVMDTMGGQPTIPVVIEVDPDSFNLPEGEDATVGEGLEEDIREGLRAQLQMQSLLTGQLFIQIDFHENRPARFHGGHELPEIPTIKTPIQELGKMLADFPIREMMDDISSAMNGVDELVNSPELHELIHSINQAFKDVSTLMTNLDARTQPLRSVFNQAAAALKATEDTMTAAKGLVSDDSEMLDAMDDALRAISDAARSVGELADAIERQPEAMLKGKGPGGGK